MHELSIATSLVEMAAEEAVRRGGVQVCAVHLKLGQLSGVFKDALLFSYEVACEGTTLQGSRLVIQDVPVIVFCSACNAETEMTSLYRFCCAVCDRPVSQVTQGREIEVVALEIQ